MAHALDFCFQGQDIFSSSLSVVLFCEVIHAFLSLANYAQICYFVRLLLHAFFNLILSPLFAT